MVIYLYISTQYENLSELVQARRRVIQEFSPPRFIGDLKVALLNRNFQLSLVNFLNYVGFVEKAPEVLQGTDLIMCVCVYTHTHTHTPLVTVHVFVYPDLFVAKNIMPVISSNAKGA